MQFPTYKQVMEDQRDLDALCADRPLETHEVFKPNAYYGMAHVLKACAGLPQQYTLKMVIPHGITFDREKIWSVEKHAPVPAVFCYSDYRRDAYERQTNKTVFAGTSPFVYLAALLRGEWRPTRSGTLFFPSHSTAHLTVEMDFERLAEQLLELDEQFQPVTVCLYWKDFLLGRSRVFSDRGFPVVSAGHIYDQDFLARLYYLLAGHKFAAGNGLGSHIFYATAAGCEVFIYGSREYSIEAEDEVLRREFAPPTAVQESAIRRAFAFPPNDSLDAARQSLTREHLGTHHQRNRAELRRQLLRAEMLDWTALSVSIRHNSLIISPPSRLLRSAKSLWNSARTLRRALPLTSHGA